MRVLAVDPGLRRCGLALVSSEGGVLERAVTPRGRLVSEVRRILTGQPVDALLVGGSTGSREVVEELGRALGREPVVVDERHSTERARARYYREHPPRGWRRWLPLGLQVPPVPYDDYAAVILAEQFLACGGEGPPRAGSVRDRSDMA